jgi:hypothetical protein
MVESSPPATTSLMQQAIHNNNEGIPSPGSAGPGRVSDSRRETLIKSASSVSIGSGGVPAARSGATRAQHSWGSAKRCVL